MDDRFRKQSKPLEPGTLDAINLIKSHAEEIEKVLDLYYPGREKAIALTKLEEAVMWAVKGITA